VPQDEKEAVKWYRLAAEQGNAAAQYNLSLMYANGQGVPQDDKEAVKWTRMAAEQGYAAAQLSLGVMYANGQGVPQDEKEAAKWMIKGRATTEPQAGDAAIKEPTADPEIQIGAEYIKEEHGDWKIVCIRTGKDNKPNCRVFQLLKDESGSAVAKLSLLALSGEAKAAASVNFVAPLGTLLSAHVAMRIDAADAKRYPFVWCEKRGCVTRFGLTQPELENLKKGNQAIMTIVSVGAPKQPIGLVVSLKDFTAAWDSLVAMNAE
jgi:TPR repeat protein